MPQSTFKVGDKVQSHPNSSDVKAMKGVWHAEIVAVSAATKTQTPDGFVYETLGRWEWLEEGLPWAGDKLVPKTAVAGRAKLTYRQLWSDHLISSKETEGV